MRKRKNDYRKNRVYAYMKRREDKENRKYKLWKNY